ncbi:MAG: hypothetical protein GY744_17500 [Gammaproteobacteria bacterium]|nr:hypothetical protein [Gammaproteobacteria bacterium]
MNKQLTEVAKKINALSLRERSIIILTVVILSGFVWWNLFAMPMLEKTKKLNQQSKSLETEILTINATTTAIQKRITDGVYKTGQQKLAQLKLELKKINDLLEAKTQALIEPEEMFDLMQQLIFAESRLKLITMKRKQVETVFSDRMDKDKDEDPQPVIYRHVMQMSFEGKFEHILKYIQKLEFLKWRLIWDEITLKTSEYPIITVNIEISTLSDNEYWVGL